MFLYGPDSWRCQGFPFDATLKTSQPPDPIQDQEKLQ
nr:MAG TPA: hypothetical protein [Bacteriophage sp.]